MDTSVTFRFPPLSVPDERHEANSGQAARTFGNETSDEALMASLCRGDQEALALLFRRYASIVRGLAYKVLRDTSEADDLLQEIFLVVYRKCASFDASRGPARSWILQITYHRALARRRYLNSRHFYARVNLDDLAKEPAAPQAQTHDFEDYGGLPANGDSQRVFDALSENQRQTIQILESD